MLNRTQDPRKKKGFQRRQDRMEEEEFSEDDFVVDDDEVNYGKKKKKKMPNYVHKESDEEYDDPTQQKLNFKKQKDISQFTQKITQPKKKVSKVIQDDNDDDLDAFLEYGDKLTHQQQTNHVLKTQELIEKPIIIQAQNRLEMEKQKYDSIVEPILEPKKRTFQEFLKIEEQVNQKQEETDQMFDDIEKIIKKNAKNQENDEDEELFNKIASLKNRQIQDNLKNNQQQTIKYSEQKIIEAKQQIRVESAQKTQNLHVSTMKEEEFINIRKQTEQEIKQCILEQDGTFCFYWIDLFEEPYSSPGELYLFGKVFNKLNKKPENCTIRIMNFMKTIYLLPIHQDFTKEQMLDECEQVMRKSLGIRKDEWTAEVVEKNYAFEIDEIPIYSKYLEVKYNSAIRGRIECKLKSTVFKAALQGTQNAWEQFIIYKKLMGPCWLKMSKPSLPSQDHRITTKFVLDIKDPNGIQVMDKNHPPTPPLTVLSIGIKGVIQETQNNKSEEILMLSMLVRQKISQDAATDVNDQSGQLFKTFIRMPEERRWPNDFKSLKQEQVEEYDSEAILLGAFLKKLSDIDPDVIIGQDLYSRILVLLNNRVKKSKSDSILLLGRLKKDFTAKFSRELPPQVKARSFTIGRLLVDTYESGQELVRGNDFSLSALGQKFLNVDFKSIESDVTSEYMKSGETIRNLVKNVQDEAKLTMDICLKLQVIPLTKQLTNICGNTWFRSLQNARAERNELLLMHEFKAKNYILPDRRSMKVKDQNIDEGNEEKGVGKKNKKKYSGGMVLEPKADIYTDFILLLDFNSLYPSIIMEYDICFTTVRRRKFTFDQFFNEEVQKKPQSNKGKKGMEEEQINEDKQEEEIDTLAQQEIGVVESNNKKKGILPELIMKLINKRKEAKYRMSQAQGVEKEVWNIRQLAVKLVANSMYGCLGFKSSRFFALGIASLITSKGRQILGDSIKTVESMNYDVIYGDTDSMMINPKKQNLKDVIIEGKLIIKKINEQYKQLQLGIDGVFQTLLLCKKKKYAGIKLTNLDQVLEQGAVPKFEREVKGIDLVRREYCDLSKTVQKMVLDILLDSKEKDNIFETLINLMEEIKSWLDYYAGINTDQDLIKKNKFINFDWKLSQFIITKNLNKAISLYNDAEKIPHLVVAKYLITQGKSSQSLISHPIPYVIIQDENQKSIGLRARHPEQFMKEVPKPTLDYYYYREQQLFDPIERLCQNVDGLSLEQMSKAIGLDGSKYQEKTVKVNVWTDNKTLYQSEKENLKKYSIICSCKNQISWDQFLKLPEDGKKNTQKLLQFLLKCPICNVIFNKDLHITLKNQIHIEMKQIIKQYYKNESRCSKNEENLFVCITDKLNCFGNCCNMESKIKQLIDHRQINHQINTLEQLLNHTTRSLHSFKETSRSQRYIQFSTRRLCEINKPFLEINLEYLFDKFQLNDL